MRNGSLSLDLFLLIFILAEDLGPQHSHGQGARPKKSLLKTGKTASPSEAAEQKATEQADQGTCTL